MGIPDWAWKLLTSLVIPIAMWAIATHVSNSEHELRLQHIESSQISTNSSIQKHGDSLIELKQLETANMEIRNTIAKQQESLNSTKEDMAVMNTKLEYVVEGIDDIKILIKEQDQGIKDLVQSQVTLQNHIINLQNGKKHED